MASSPRPHATLPSHLATSFSSFTDPTLHRHSWKSPRAIDEQPRGPSRRLPVRYRALLRYDILSPSPPPVSIPPNAGSLSARTPSSRGCYSETGRQGSLTHRAIYPKRVTTAPEPNGDDDEDSEDKTNLDELKWFQHRWLGKHGKDSHMKEYREKLTLLRRWFESLDADGSGEVGVDELEDPLVSVGLARSRNEVEQLIAEVDKDDKGEVTFSEFLCMMNPKKPKPFRQIPLHKPRQHVLEQQPHIRSRSRPESRRATAPDPRTIAQEKKLKAATVNATVQPVSNPVVKLFEDLQSGKLGDLAIPFPVLITAYRRRMLLNAHMAEDPTARRAGSSVLQALERTRREAVAQQQQKEVDTSVASESSTSDMESISGSYNSKQLSYLGKSVEATRGAHNIGRTSQTGMTLLPTLTKQNTSVG